MAAIRLSQFGGLVPRVNDRKIPKFSATAARNVDMRSGSLKPILVEPPFQSLHDETTGSLKSGLNWGDLISIDKPDPVTLVNRIKMARPAYWANIYLYVYITYVDPDTGAFVSNQIEFGGGVTWDHKYTDDGFVLQQRGGQIDFNATAGVAYMIHGPIAQFVFTADDKYNGGPEATFTCPNDVDFSTPPATGFSLPLTYPVTMDDYGTDGQTTTAISRYTYGFLELVDWDLPAVEQFVETDVDVTDYNVTGGTYVASFRFRCNYVRGGQQFAYYLQSFVDKAITDGTYNDASTTAVVKLDDPLSTTVDIPSTGKLRDEDGNVYTYTSYTFNIIDSLHEFTMDGSVALHDEGDIFEVIDLTSDGGREGPPSEISELITVDPGEILQLQCEAESTATALTRLYRSSTGAEGSFNLLEEDAASGTSAYYIDNYLLPLTEALPPYGNYPHSTKDMALIGSVYHPAQWGALFYGNKVYPSDIFRPWAYPDEYTIAFPQQVIALAISGNSIIVFCEESSEGVGKVYELTGNDPRYLSAYELSNAHPLLNRVGLAKMGQTVYWPTYDGIAATTGGKIDVVTEMFFTRERWLEEDPGTMSCYTSENTLWIITAESRNWRVDFDELNKEPFTFLSTFTAFSGEELVWTSKQFSLEKVISWSHARVRAMEYPVALELYDGDGLEQAAVMIRNDTIHRLPRMRAGKDWKFRVHGFSEITEVSIGTTAVELT